MTFYAVEKDGIFATKYRLSVSAGHGFMTGEAFHSVRVESADCSLNPLTGKYERIERYAYDREERVHCCYNHREAAEYVANKMGLRLEA